MRRVEADKTPQATMTQLAVVAELAGCLHFDSDRIHIVIRSALKYTNTVVAAPLFIGRRLDLNLCCSYQTIVLSSPILNFSSLSLPKVFFFSSLFRAAVS